MQTFSDYNAPKMQWKCFLCAYAHLSIVFHKKLNIGFYLALLPFSMTSLCLAIQVLVLLLCNILLIYKGDFRTEINFPSVPQNDPEILEVLGGIQAYPLSFGLLLMYEMVEL